LHCFNKWCLPIMKGKEKAPLECYVITTWKNKSFLLPTIIETIILAIPKTSPANCKPFPLPNHIKDIITLSPTKIGLFIDEGPRPKSDKLRFNPHGTILEGKSNWLELKKRIQKGESSWFEKPRCKLRSNIRIQSASNESKLVPTNLNLGPHLKCT